MAKKKPFISHDPLAGIETSAMQVDPAVSAASATDEPGTNVDVHGDIQRIDLPPSLNITDVSALHGGLMSKLQAGNLFQLDGSQVDMVEGAGIQLLAAFFKEVSEKGGTVCWHAASAKLIDSARQMGLAEFLKMDDLQPIA
jgi:anti-anti-sigma regulatory factor